MRDDPRWLPWLRACVLLAAAATLQAQQAGDPGPLDPSKFDARRPLAQELKTSVADGFSLVAVGDCIISRPLSQYADRERDFAQTLRVLKSADATYGNLETSILDIRQFKGSPYTGADDFPLLALPGVARDLSAMGFDLMSRANNHALDWGAEGMRETTRWADDAGLVTAGVGDNLGLARAARYFESAKGRIAIVSMASTYRPGSEALPQMNGAPGRAGVNSLAVKKTVIVPPDVLHDLQRIAGKLYPGFTPPLASGGDNKFTLFGTQFEAGPSRANRYDMNETDLAGILRAVRQGKQHSDLLLATLHSHETADTSEPDPKNDFAEAPAAFVKTLARAAIDSGADAFLVTGIHHLGPIEIYKGRPIFYGLGDFFWSDIQEPMPADFYAQYRRSLVGAFKNPERATDADLANALNAEAFNGEPPFESVITQSRYDHGQVVEVRLYPVYLGYGMKLTESGIPRVPSPEEAAKILRRMQEMSKPYGTTIAIQPDDVWHFVGTIHP